MTDMTEVKTADLSGPALDWAVGSVDSVYGLQVWHFTDGTLDIRFCEPETEDSPRTLTYSPSTDWAQGGALIEKYTVSIEYGVNQDSFPGWSAIVGPVTYMQEPDAMGGTPLIAACRAIVAAKLGDVVSVPSELISQ
jgi:hypothetical protein